MKRVDAIKKMLGVANDAAPIEFENELIYPWDINLDLLEFSDEQIEEFYDAEEVKNEKRTTKQSR